MIVKQWQGHCFLTIYLQMPLEQSGMTEVMAITSKEVYPPPINELIGYLPDWFRIVVYE